MPRASRGRVRLTCSDRCRQIKRRQEWYAYRTRQEKKAWRRAEREVRKIERRLGGPGSLDIPVTVNGFPGDTYLTLRKRVLIHLARGEEIPFCEVCGLPYIIDTLRHYPTCKGKCATIYGERQRAVQRGLAAHRGQYDPRVDVRVQLRLPIKACAQCGKPFPPYRAKRKYCSERCRSNAWYARNPLRRCVQCGERFRGKGNVQPKKYCSERCRWTAAFARRRAARVGG